MSLNKRTTESTMELQEHGVEEAEPEVKKLTMKEKFSQFRSLITVEPVLFLYLFATSIALGAIRNLPFEMGCRVNRGLNDTVCSDITIGISHVGQLIGRAHQWSQPISKAIPAILVLCFGAFSDRYKIRKPFIIIPVAGEIFSCIGLIFCAIFIEEWPMEMYYVMASVLPSFFGGSQTVLMAIYSYISDISTQETRTARIGFVEIVSLILTPIGPLLSGILYEKTGYFGVFPLCLVLFSLGVLYGIFFVKESASGIERKKNLCLDIFDVRTVLVNAFKVVLRKRERNKRKLLILLFVSYILIMGSNDNLYIHLYAVKEFAWKQDYLGYYSAFDITVHIIGMIVAISLLIKKYHLNDILIAIIACCFKIVSGFWYAFGKNVILFCLGPVVSVFSGLYVIALRSLVTKLVDQPEIAQTQALFGICEVVVPVVYNTVYYQFYIATKDQFHGAFFLLGSILVTPALFILLGMYVVHKQDLDKDFGKKEETKTEDNGTTETDIDGIQTEKL